MDISTFIGLVVLAGAVGTMIVIGWRSKGRSLADQFHDLPAPPKTPDVVAREHGV